MSQYVVSINPVLDIGSADTHMDVYGSLSAAQTDAQQRAAAAVSDVTWYVHEVTSTPVFRAVAIRSVETEVL